MIARIGLVFLAAALSAGRAHAGLDQVSSLESFGRSVGTPLQALLPASGRLTSWDEEGRLIDLLDDPSPEVRAQAARSLKNYLPMSLRAERALLGILLEGREALPVRREAVKSLSRASAHYDTRDKLRSYCADDAETAALRALSCKALYGAARDGETRRILQLTLVDSQVPAEARAGAAWALFADFNDSETRRKLSAEAVDDNEPLALRVEAVKSLYQALGDWQARHAVEELARDESVPEALRAAAALCLHAVNSDWQTRDLLEKISNADPSPAVRSAAIQALQRGESLDLVRYFHLSAYLGRFVDPLEDQ